MTDKFTPGERVTRKQVNAFQYHRYQEGTIIEKTPEGRNKIKWDDKTDTGQQHSTIQDKFLTHLPAATKQERE